MRAIIAALCAVVVSTPAGARCPHGESVSWYEGIPTKSGLPGCAHREAPRGSIMRVAVGGRSVDCQVNDWGPSRWTGCEIDVSEGAARQLGILIAGVARANVEIFSRAVDPEPRRRYRRGQ